MRVLELGVQYGGHILDRSGGHRASDDDGVECLRLSRRFELLNEILYDAIDVSEVGLAARGRRRADTQERDVGILEGIRRAVGGP